MTRVCHRNMLRHLISALLLPFLLCSVPGSAQTTTRVSLSGLGAQGNYGSGRCSIGADGQSVAFMSSASNFRKDDSGIDMDLFVKSVGGGLVWVNQTEEGHQMDLSTPDFPTISPDGTRVVFAQLFGDLRLRDLVGHETPPRVASGSEPCFSADGRFLAFSSRGHVYRLNLSNRQTLQVDVKTGGIAGAAGGRSPSISGNGRYVAFASNASDLVPNDTNGELDAFVHDCWTRETTRVSVDSNGNEARREVGTEVYDEKVVAISADGRYVAFCSSLGPLAANDQPPSTDIFLHDMQTGETKMVSVDSAGNPVGAGGVSLEPSISADGRFVAFRSNGRLIAGDTHGGYEIYVHDNQTGETTRVSNAPDGSRANGFSFLPSISADGRYVAFESYASNLVPGDTNSTVDVFLHDRGAGSPLTYNVSGKVALPPGVNAGAMRVKALVGGVEVMSGTINANGSFAVGGLPIGEYDIVPSIPGWDFVPEMQTVNVTYDFNDLIFTAVPPAGQVPVASSETYWDLSLGMYGGGWFGPAAQLGPLAISGVRVAALAGDNWGLRVGITTDTTGKQVLNLKPSYSVEARIPYELGPKVDATFIAAAGGVSGTASYAKSFGQEYSFDQAIGPGANSLERFQAAMVILSSFTLCPGGTTTGSRLLLRAMLGIDPGESTYSNLVATEKRSEAKGTVNANAYVSVGTPLHGSAAASTNIIDSAWASAETSVGAGFRQLYPRESADPNTISITEQAQKIDVAGLEALVDDRAQALDALTNALAFMPEPGATGICGRELAKTGYGVPAWAAASCAADVQTGGSLFYSASDARTVRLQAPVATLYALNNRYGMAALPRTMQDALNLAPMSGGPTTLVQDMADWAAILEKYSEENPEQPVASFTRTHDTAEGVAFDLYVGLGVGFGIAAGLKGSLLQGFVYDELQGQIVNGDLVYDVHHDETTVPPQDPRSFSDVCGNILSRVAQDVAPALTTLVKTWLGGVSGAQVRSANAGDIVVGDAAEGSELIGLAGQWANGCELKLAAYSPDLPGVSSTGLRAVVPYSFTQRVGTAAAGSLQFTTIVGVGDVRVVRIDDPGDNPIEHWEAGDAKLRVTVTAADLTAHGVDASLHSNVTLHRFDPETYTWSAVSTTRNGDVFEAALSQDGEYLPAVATGAVDSLGPQLVRLVPASGSGVFPRPTIAATIADQPATSSAGVSTTGLALLLDGAAMANVGMQADASGLTLLATPAVDLAPGQHQISVQCRDNLGNTSFLGPYAFTVLEPSAMLDLGACVRGWREFRATGTIPPGMDVTGDGALGVEDLNALVENALR